MGLTGQNYNWRPNDNSASTRIKYDLEAEHWVRSINSAQRKYQPRSFLADMATVFTILGLAFSILNIFFLLLGGILEFIYRLISGEKKENNFSTIEGALDEWTESKKYNKKGILLTSESLPSDDDDDDDDDDDEDYEDWFRTAKEIDLYGDDWE